MGCDKMSDINALVTRQSQIADSAPIATYDVYLLNVIAEQNLIGIGAVVLAVIRSCHVHMTNNYSAT